MSHVDNFRIFKFSLLKWQYWKCTACLSIAFQPVWSNLKRRKLPGNGKNNPTCWLNEKPTRPSHKEEMSQSSVFFNWHDTCNRKGLYLHSAWQHTTQVFKAGEPIGDTVCHKQIPSRLLDTFHFNPICKTLTFLINCESKSPGFARLCVKCKREYLNLSVNKQTHKSKARWGESSTQYPGCNPCLLFNFKMTNQWQNGIK